MNFKEGDKVRNIADGQEYVVHSININTVLVEKDSNIHEMVVADVEKVEE